MSYGSTRRRKYLEHSPVRVCNKNKTACSITQSVSLFDPRGGTHGERVTGVVTNDVTENDAPSHSIKASGHSVRPGCDNILLASPCRSPIHSGLRHTRPFSKPSVPLFCSIQPAVFVLSRLPEWPHHQRPPRDRNRAHLLPHRRQRV